ncbi:hypothetical protein OHA25_08455 [Nonomuraea sp. NBC_00507]|uniref:hypothetical protein n=1 Tax=Nonomuraea sp. NBC_00507 TaxID=2976002 RepID=UPI002E18E844
MTNRFDPLPTDSNRLHRELEKRVEALEARAGLRDPITELSLGVILRGMAAPDTSGLPATDGKVYVKGGRLTFRGGGNAVEVQLVPIPKAGHVNDVTGTADDTYGTVERDILNALVFAVNSMLANFQLVDLMG